MNTLRLVLSLGVSVSLAGSLSGCPDTTSAGDAGRDAGRGAADAPLFLDAFVDPSVDAHVVVVPDAFSAEDAPGLDAPGSDAPGSDAPGSDAPGSDAPGADAPGSSDAPIAMRDAYVPPTSDAGMCMDLPPDPTRMTGVVCSPCRPPGAMSSGGRGECMSDADCTEGANGRCGFGRAGTFCSYDLCFSDADCDADEACLCDGSGLGGGGNSCVRADCRTNNDCSPGFACSPTFGGCGHYTGFIGFECHTAADECTVDADCGGAAYCAFDSAVSHWACSTSECAG